MEEQYRTPNIDEFIQDFEFEKKIRRGGESWFLFHPGLTKEECQKACDTNRQPIVDDWVSIKVWWKPRTIEEATITDTDITGETYQWTINPKFDAPFSIQTMLDQGKIRVKI